MHSNEISNEEYEDIRCSACNGRIFICCNCDGSGFQEPHSAGTYLEPYPCLTCSGWNGDPDSSEFWDAAHKSWRPGSGLVCETQGCSGQLD